jgi:hypothetical protein
LYVSLLHSPSASRSFSIDDVRDPFFGVRRDAPCMR